MSSFSHNLFYKGEGERQFFIIFSLFIYDIRTSECCATDEIWFRFWQPKFQYLNSERHIWSQKYFCPNIQMNYYGVIYMHYWIFSVTKVYALQLESHRQRNNRKFQKKNSYHRLANICFVLASFRCLRGRCGCLSAMAVVLSQFCFGISLNLF